MLGNGQHRTERKARLRGAPPPHGFLLEAFPRPEAVLHTDTKIFTKISKSNPTIYKNNESF